MVLLVLYLLSIFLDNLNKFLVITVIAYSFVVLVRLIVAIAFANTASLFSLYA